MMTDEQRRYAHARKNFEQRVILPAKELLEATASLVNLATARADETEKTMEQLRPVWAQGWTSVSEAAQASAHALAELWAELGVENQTDAMHALNELRERAGD